MTGKRCAGVILASALAFALAACGSEGASGTSGPPAGGETKPDGAAAADSGKEPVTLRAAWWGNQSRAKIYNEIFDLYEKQNPHIKIVRETAEYGDYYTKLATQAAGGNAPDLMGMHMLNASGDYISKGVLEPLDPYIQNGMIDTKEWDAGILDSGKVDGVMYGLSKGVTFTTVVVNKSMLAKAGMALPDHTMTYAEYADFAAQLQAKLSKGVYASSDSIQWEHGIDTWARQKGKNLMTPDGKALGFGKEDLAEYYAFWNNLVKAGVATPASITAEYAGQPQENSTLVKGITATLITNLNQAKIYTNYFQDELDVIRWPLMEGGKYRGGENLQSSAWSVSQKSKHKEEAVKLLNWFVNDVEAGKLFKAELGIPGSLKVQEALKDSLHPLDVKGFALMNEISKDAPPSTIRPPGAPQVITVLRKFGDQVSFNRMSAEQAADAAFAEIAGILAAKK